MKLIITRKTVRQIQQQIKQIKRNRLREKDNLLMYVRYSDQINALEWSLGLQDPFEDIKSIKSQSFVKKEY